MKKRSRDHGHCPCNRQLDVPPPAVAAETGSYSRFKLPDDGWIVKAVPRRGNASHVDKYYYEEGSGTLFQSLKAVERYINGGEYPSKSRAKKCPRYAKKDCSRPRRARKYIMRGGKVMKLDEEEFNQNHQSVVDSTANVGISICKLPDGWVIEVVPRRSFGDSDKYYYEPGTGRKFRSLVAVFRHLEEEIVTLSAYIEEIKENVPLSKAFKLHPKLKDVFRKRNLTTSSNGDGQTSSFDVSRKRSLTPTSTNGDGQTSSSSFVSPPKKIKWVLISSEGDVWCPFIFEKTPVSDSVKQQWNQRFMEVMKDDDNDQPNSELNRF